jgi:hypothetical protein
MRWETTPNACTTGRSRVAFSRARLRQIETLRNRGNRRLEASDGSPVRKLAAFPGSS